MLDLNGLTLDQKVRDLDSAYRDTYLYASLAGAPLECIYMKRFNSAERTIVAEYYPDVLKHEPGHVPPVFAQIDTLFIDDKLPPSGLVQDGSAIFYVARAIDRQFKKGLCSDNTTIVRVLGHGHMNNRGIKGLFKAKEFKVLDEIQTEFQNNVFTGGLLSDELAAGSYGGTDVVSIAWNDKVVGWIPKGAKRTFLMKEFYWLQPKIVDHCDILDII